MVEKHVRQGSVMVHFGICTPDYLMNTHALVESSPFVGTALTVLQSLCLSCLLPAESDNFIHRIVSDCSRYRATHSQKHCEP